MAAYFSIDFQYKKTDFCDTTVKDFFEKLLHCGLIYKSGFQHPENDSLNDSLDEILIWNQRKLEKVFELENTEPYSLFYKQMLFYFHDFSEVRLIINDFYYGKHFSFYLIIPEEDFLEYDGRKYKHLYPKMKIIEDFVCSMWETGDICCIQSSWECSEGATDFADITKGATPSIEPFAIVPDSMYNTEWICSCENIERNGVFLKNNDNWFYT